MGFGAGLQLAQGCLPEGAFDEIAGRAAFLLEEGPFGFRRIGREGRARLGIPDEGAARGSRSLLRKTAFVEELRPQLVVGKARAQSGSALSPSP